MTPVGAGDITKTILIIPVLEYCWKWHTYQTAWRQTADLTILYKLLQLYLTHTVCFVYKTMWHAKFQRQKLSLSTHTYCESLMHSNVGQADSTTDNADYFASNKQHSILRKFISSLFLMKWFFSDLMLFKSELCAATFTKLFFSRPKTNIICCPLG